MREDTGDDEDSETVAREDEAGDYVDEAQSDSRTDNVSHDNVSDDVLAELPSLGQLLRRRPMGFVLPTLMIGLGVLSCWCVGIGFLPMAFGASSLLRHTAKVAGREPGPVRMMPGVLAVVLAILLGLAACLGVFVADSGDFSFTVAAFTIGAALMGAGLSPLALAPVASACHASGPIQPLITATDMAGADSLPRLAGTCALIAVSLLVPIPLVAIGLGAGLTDGDPGYAFLGLSAFLFWGFAVPTSAAALTLRFLRLQRRNDAPTRLRSALTPVLGAVAIGVVALGACVFVSAGRSPHVQQVPRDGVAMGDDLAGGWPDGHQADAYAYPSHNGVWVGGLVGSQHIRSPFEFPDRGPVQCRQLDTWNGGLEVRCDQDSSRFLIRVAPDGSPVPVDLRTRIRDSFQLLGGFFVLLALGVFSLALLWLGRLGAALRVLSQPRFRWTGRLESDSNEAVTFIDESGERRVRVPRGQLRAAPGHTLDDGAAGVLLSDELVAPMDFRTAQAPCPAGALLVVGSIEDACASQVVRARKIGFRLAVLALSLLGAACVAVLLQL